ncbi:O-antigen ligase family protein [Pengzhenrongella sicca]|uniref:O-antigen ligase family protein n=1 Tax=Pengzhenrongella sicca TaxID=2819238 RepID=A0A8A4ZAB6_9MICO|nr:O-antigen ligase family protein [Pengzhenrongella sicca]QTE28900.1 O-antigen ligase family protein [Pengzhenrongella sicca]
MIEAAVRERRGTRRPAADRAQQVWYGVQDRALAATIVGLTAVAVALAGVAGLPTVLIYVLAAAPILVVVGSRYALVILAAAIGVRALVDNAGQLATGGIAVALIGLALLVSWRASSWLLVLFGISGFLVLSALYGAPRFGAAVTFGEAVRLISALSVVLITINVSGRFTAFQLARIVQLVGFIPALVAIYQLITGTGSQIDGLNRAAGTLAQSNPAAALFALCNLATFALLLARAPRRGLNIAFLLVFVAAQAATGTISGVVTFLVMALVYVFTLRHARIERVLLAVVGVALVAYLAAQSDVGQSRLAEFTGPGADPLSKENSLGWRIEAWGKVLDSWRQHPIFGNGVGATRGDIILVGNIPHNEYVRILAENGVVGLAFVLGAAAVFGARMLRTIGRTTDVAPSFALAVLAGTFVNAIAANTFLYSTTFYLTLFVLAGCWRLANEPAPAADPTPDEALG